MKKLIKIVLGLLGGCILAFIGLAVGLRILLPPDKARAFVQSRLGEALDREVRLESVSVGLLSGLQVTGFRLSEIPTFAKGTFLSCERLVLRPRLLPLLTGQVLIREIELTRPEATVIRFADGSTNLTASKAAAKEPSQAGNLPAATQRSRPPDVDPLQALSIARLTVKRGAFHFVDRSTAALSATADPVDVSARNLTFAGPADVEFSLQLAARGRTAKVSSNARIHGLTRSATIETLTIETGSGTVTARGDISPERATFTANLAAGALAAKAEGSVVFSDTPTLSVRLSAPALPTAELIRYAPAGALPPEMTLSGVLGVDVQGKGTPDQLDFVAVVTGDALGVSYGTSFEKPAGVPMSVRAAGVFRSPQTVDAKDIRVSLTGMTLQGSAQSGAAGVELRLASDSFALAPVAALLPDTRAYHPTGTGRLTLHLVTGERSLMDATFELRDGTARYERSDAMDLETTAHYNSGTLRIPRLTGKLNGSDFQVELTGRSLDTRPVLAATIEIDTLDIEKLLPWNPEKKTGRRRSPFVPEAHAAEPAAGLIMDMTGTLQVGRLIHPFYSGRTLRAAWNLRNITDDLGRLDGKATVDQGPGDVKNIQKLVQDSRAARLLLLPLSVLQKLSRATGGAIRLPSLERLSFRDLSGVYEFENGVMNIRRFDLHGSELDAELSGTVGLAGSQPLHVNAKLILPPGALGGTAERILHTSGGRTGIGAKIGGTVAAPVVTLDLAEVGKRALGEIERKIREKIGGSDDGKPPRDRGKEDGTIRDLFRDLLKRR